MTTQTCIQCGETKCLSEFHKQKQHAHFRKCESCRGHDLRGQRFGLLVVEERAERTPYGHARWSCRCDCGGTLTTHGNSLKSGRTTSCGCRRKLAAAENGRKSASDRTLLPAEKAAINCIVAAVRTRAHSKNRAYELSYEQVRDLVLSPCHYCNSPPANRMSFRTGKATFAYSGIDRVDSSGGYTPENTVPCCLICNQAKSDLSLEEWNAWLTRLLTHQQSRQNPA